MANKKGLFGILNDGAGAGVGVDLANPDTTLGSAIDNTIASPAFVDSSGVLVFPELDANGRIQVVIGQGVCHWGRGQVTGSTSFQDVAEVTGALTKVYKNFDIAISSMTECDWELVYIDDADGTPAETILGAFDTGPGQYTVMGEMDCVEIDTTGATGTQKFVLRGKLLEATGALASATLSFLEEYA